jgi:hypothetical protein
MRAQTFDSCAINLISALKLTICALVSMVEVNSLTATSSPRHFACDAKNPWGRLDLNALMHIYRKAALRSL